MSVSEQSDTGPDRITDDLARFIWDQITEDTDEPLPGSVVCLGGPWGTAYQRWFNDGLWHSTRDRGGPKDWTWLLGRRNLTLVYDAEERPPELDYGPGNPHPARLDQPIEPSRLTGADAEALS